MYRILIVVMFVGGPAALHAGEDEVLGKKGSEWLKILREHKEVKFRRAAIIALEVIGPRGKGVLAGLYESLEKDSDPEIRREVALLLGRMGPEAKGAVGALGAALKGDKAEVVREAAAQALGGKLAEQAHTQV